MSVTAQGIDQTLLPTEQLLFSSSVAAIGVFRCGSADPLFHDSGPIRNHIFAFPRTVVGIRHEGGQPFVASPNTVPLYNRGQVYTRKQCGQYFEDRSDWFAVAPDVLRDVCRALDPSTEDRLDRPFLLPYVTVTDETYLAERELVRAVASADPFAVEEGVVALLHSVAGAIPERRRVEGTVPRTSRERVEHAKEVMAGSLERPLSLRDVARETDTSVYHLCSIFRRETGMTMANYRLRLRLRLAYDQVVAGAELLETALRLGFSSHSHFSFAFRGHFGVTPSEARRRAMTATATSA